MTHNPQKAKAGMLKLWSSKNFANRALYMLTGFDELVNDENAVKDLYRVDMAYDLIAPELSTENNQTKPSKALATVAFTHPLKPEDYQKLIKMTKAEKPSLVELKQLLMQDVDHQPTEKVIDYLTFPILAAMTTYLRPAPKSEILLLRPELIHQTLDTVRARTLRELLTDNDVMVLKMRAPELKADLEIKEVPVSNQKISDFNIVQTQTHWANVRDARKITPQTGIGRQMALWRLRHNVKE